MPIYASRLSQLLVARESNNKRKTSDYEIVKTEKAKKTKFEITHFVVSVDDEGLAGKIKEFEGEESRIYLRQQIGSLYEEAQEVLMKENPQYSLSYSNRDLLKALLLAHTKIPIIEIKLDYPKFGEEFKKVKLPLCNNIFAKEYLSYFSQFQYKMENDDEILSKAKNGYKEVLTFKGPTGCGKTSAAIRLCNIPGMYLKCTQPSNDNTCCNLMEQMYEYLISKSDNLYELYGCVEQVVLLTFICQLIYIIKLIENAIENPQVIQPFEGILPYLAFMQSNGFESKDLFKKALKYVYTSTMMLNSLIDDYICDIIKLLNENSKIFKLSKIDNFIVVIDEAHIYANDHKLSNLISLDGRKLGLFPIIATKIVFVRKFHLPIFVGTNFSVFIRTSAKRQSTMEIKNYEFFEMECKQVIPFLQQHINIPKMEFVSSYLDEKKYFKRSVIMLALEILENNNDSSNQKLVNAFKKSVEINLKVDSQFNCYLIDRNPQDIGTIPSLEKSLQMFYNLVFPARFPGPDNND